MLINFELQELIRIFSYSINKKYTHNKVYVSPLPTRTKNHKFRTSGIHVFIETLSQNELTNFALRPQKKIQNMHKQQSKGKISSNMF